MDMLPLGAKLPEWSMVVISGNDIGPAGRKRN
jgi:hypothetical protein